MIYLSCQYNVFIRSMERWFVKTMIPWFNFELLRTYVCIVTARLALWLKISLLAW